jgi:hypothetical protein
MEMTIEEAIEILSQSAVVIGAENWQEARHCAIDTMRKYQKIEDIVRDYYNEQYTDKLDIEIIEMISEVLEEDGSWED